MKQISLSKGEKKTARFLRKNGPRDTFARYYEKYAAELRGYLDGKTARPAWLRGLDLMPAGNRKTKLATFGTYAGHGCAGYCVACYAMGGSYIWDNVIDCRAKRAALLDVAPAIFWDIFRENVARVLRSRSLPKIVRLFDAGDVPGPAFLPALYDVARQFPGVRFYGYTKKLDLLKAAGPAPKNVVFMRSRYLKPAGDKRAAFLTVNIMAGDVAPASYKQCPGSNCAACQLCVKGALVWAPLHD